MHRTTLFRLSMPLLLAACLALPISAPARAQISVSEGQTAGGAFFRIEMPFNWNGKLIIWNHGFDLDPIGPVSDVGPLADINLLEGYAVAASSYRHPGWALFHSSRDLELLVAEFEARFRVPDEVLIYGASLGGIVTAAAIEQADLGNVTGALAFCGAMGGSRNWDGAIDLRLIYDWVCRKVPAGTIPGGGRGLPEDSGLSETEVAARVNACTGVDLAPGDRTAKQRRNLKKLIKFSGLPEEFIQTVMGYSTFALSDLIDDPGKLRGRQGVGNENVDYGKRRLNRQIERVKSKRSAQRKLNRNYTPSGKVGDVKVVSIHTDKDGLVIVENQHEYASVMPPDQLTVAVVVEDEPSHCEFTPGEVLAAWDALLGWIDTGVQPTAADLADACPDFALLLGGECRFDPGFVVRSMDRRVRPRDP